MSKIATRPYAPRTRHALTLFGQLVREARIKSALTTTELATRAGISRSLLQRIEAGDPGCSIGVAFEVAAICGVPLFEASESSLASRLSQQTEKLTLMPKTVRSTRKVVKDDF
jgi:ribosome-binding protein aMBF1 (putative translation factor)